MRFDDFDLDIGRRQLLRGGEVIHLPPKGLLLLRLLIERRPNAISKAEIYDHLWPSTFVSEVNLPGLIAELRAALGDDARNPRYIRTVHGFGYAFCPEASAAAAEEEAVVALLIFRGRDVRLPAGETIIGRDPELRCCIDDPTVSRHHAVITCSIDTATIRDLDSKNGTCVRGSRITEPVDLHDGETMVIGSVDVIFRRPHASPSTITVKPQR